MTSTPINIMLDGQTILDSFDSVNIKFSEGTYCNSIDISVADESLWDAFDPIKNFGQLRLQVLIGSTTYKFMIEERTATVGIPGVKFTVWGRSAQALLDAPYSKLVNDEEEKVHPWQLDDSNPDEIIQYAIDYCCGSDLQVKPVVHWNVENFVVYKDSFSASNTTPISIINQLATIIGAELIPNADGSLSVNEYSVQQGMVIQEYDDFDEVVELSEDTVYPVGFNKVTVNGYGSTESTSGQLTAELQDDDLKGWEFNKDRTVRVYYYHPKNLDVVGYIEGGDLSRQGSGTEEFVEWVVLIWGEGSTTHFNTIGESDIKGDTSIPIEFRKVTYYCKYVDFSARSLIGVNDDPQQGIMLFCFTDHSSSTTLGFDPYDESGDDELEIQLDWEPEGEDEGSISSEDNADNTVSRVYRYFPSYADIIDPNAVHLSSGNTPTASSNSGVMIVTDGQTVSPKGSVGTGLVFRVWGAYNTEMDWVKDCVYSTITPSKTQCITETFEEEIGFFNGEGTLQHPYYSSGSVVWLQSPGGSAIFTKGKTKVTLSSYNKDKPFALGKVTYKSNYTKGTATIPKSYSFKEFFVYLKKTTKYNPDGSAKDPEYLTISQSVSNEDTTQVTYQDVTIVVKDFATDIVIPNATVVIDGTKSAGTDSNGEAHFSKIAVGDHAIRITAPGYLDSDEDELANDTFTVSAS